MSDEKIGGNIPNKKTAKNIQKNSRSNEGKKKVNN